MTIGYTMDILWISAEKKYPEFGTTEAVKMGLLRELIIIKIRRPRIGRLLLTSGCRYYKM